MKSKNQKDRMLGRDIARDLSYEELQQVAGSGPDPTFSLCLTGCNGGSNCADQHHDDDN